MPAKKAAKRPARRAATAKTAKKAPARAAAAKRPPAKKAAPKKEASKKATAKKAVPKKATPKKAAPRKPAAKPVFGRAGTAGKAEGDEAVRAWIEGVKPEHRPIVERLDALVGEVVPDVKRAVKWSMPMYGRPGLGWFAHLGSFKDYVALGFFVGTQLDPEPPHGESGSMRRARIHDVGEFDEARFRSWIRQASSRPGWGKV